MGMWKWIFGFAMVDMPLGGGLKCTKRPSRSAYLRELGLIFNKNQKLLKKSIWARWKVDLKMGKFRENPDLGQESSRSGANLCWKVKKSDENEKKKCAEVSEELKQFHQESFKFSLVWHN